MIGRSPAFLAALRLIDKLAKYDATVLIEGETGTGKELAARAIHYQGDRHGKPFVSVNCGALPDLLVENELFGHKRGAYTDARVDSPGLLSLANGGTLFLDEIDSLSPKAQVILLRVLQDQQFRPLGARHEETVDVRIIAACNRSLQALTQSGQFREDLLFRINLLYLELPPLRLRHGDPELLARDFVRHFSERYRRPEPQIARATLDWLDVYSWPGNVRELENLVHREFLLTDGGTLMFTLPPALRHEPPPQDIASGAVAGISDAAYAIAKEIAVKNFSEHYLQTLMIRTQGNVSVAARHAGKERRALGRLLKKYGIAPANFR